VAVRALGRFLQVLGLIVLPVGLLYGTSSGRPDAIRIELVALGFGALAFLAGTALLRRGG
jgi:hypothetical protein